MGYDSIADLYEDALGRPDEAIRWNHKAHQRDPAAKDPLFQLAALYFVLDDEASESVGPGLACPPPALRSFSEGG
jgi:hypothetical protein